MATAGRVVGFFFALLVLVSVLPLIFLLIRYWRRHYSSDPNAIFEAKLSRSALEAKEIMETTRKLKKSGGMGQSSALSDDTPANEAQEWSENDFGEKSTDDLTLKSFKAALQDQHAYFGIKDLFFPAGHIPFLSRIFGRQVCLPPGLLEDFTFYVCNNVNPLPFLFGDKENPTTLLTRYVVYCNSQVFTLVIYLIIDKDYRFMVEILMSPIVLLCEVWLTRMVSCPCLQRSFAPGGGSKETCEVWSKRLLRVVGGLLSLPLLLVMMTLLIILAIGLANETIQGGLLGRFVFDGIVLPFLIKLLLASASFLYPLHPHQVNMCGVNVFKINNWTEMQFVNEDLLAHHHLSEDLIKDKKEEHWKKSFGEASIFHMNCYCLRYIGLPADPSYRVDVCHPSCYCARCCNAISELYWEVPDEESKYSRRKLQYQSAPKDSSLSIMLMQAGAAEDEEKGVALI